MFGSVTTAVLVVSKVWCSSGAPVSYDATVRPGEHQSVLAEAFDDFAALDWTMRIPMTSGDRSYAKSRPPCPMGDVLNIKFEAPASF